MASQDLGPFALDGDELDGDELDGDELDGDGPDGDELDDDGSVADGGGGSAEAAVADEVRGERGTAAAGRGVDAPGVGVRAPVASQISADLPSGEGAPAQAPPSLTPVQQRTHAELLQVGAPRPYSPPKVADELRQLIRERTEAAVASWTEPSLFISKSKATSLLTCEGKAAEEMSTPWSGKLHPATAVGTLVHRAIQIAHTHPGHPIATYVSSAVDASVRGDSAFADFFESADLGVQSDLMSQATSKVTLFLDSWPPLLPAWTPRFEESVQAKVGKLTLSARPDLVLGRPKHDGRRTVLLCDFKTGALSDRHEFEALFYALVSTLRHGMVPFRSVVYSLASAEWVAPDLTTESLVATAVKVSDVAVAHVEVMADLRKPDLTPGPHCAWCPLSKTCEVSSVRVLDDPGPAPSGAVSEDF